MPRTSTSFKPGHKGMGGRPKGSRKGATNTWRKAAKRARDVGRRADQVQSELLERRTTMVTSQLSRFVAVLRKRRNAHNRRSKHVRPIFKSGGIEVSFGGKIVPRPRVADDSAAAFKKRAQIGKQPTLEPTEQPRKSWS
jgi:hypothetical protein